MEPITRIVGSLLGVMVLLAFLSFFVGEDNVGIQGLAVRRMFEKPFPAALRYCHGWEENKLSCFKNNGVVKPFRCQSYYWVPVGKGVVSCCQTYFDCRSAGSFRFSSYCDQKTHTCKFN